MYRHNVWTLWGITTLVMLLILAACGGAPAANAPETDAPAAEETAPAEEEATAEEATTEEATPAEDEATTEDETATTATAEEGTAGAVVDASLSGELVLYTTRSEALINGVLEAFNEQYPNITVTSVNGSNSELGARILEEQANPQANVFINSDTLTMEDLYASGVFQPNESELILAVPEQYRADDGSWTALTLRGRVLMYNTDLLSEDEVPTSLTALADPEWSDRIGSADSTNGAMVATIVALNRLLDEETTAGWIQGLVDNNTLFSGSHTDIRQAVGTGEIELGLVNHYYYFLSLEEGAPVGIVWPDQGDDEIGLIVNSTNIGILQGTEGETLELAQAFVDFMLDTTGQTIYAQGNFEWPVKADIPLADGVPNPDDFTIADINLKTLVDDAPTAREQIQTVGMP
ncbi:MAG: extracellular solute-binding protein [Chloroflexi bacterium AL-W]|nr:extracellular solute-binding protein [Chloroflexi bacterium AL-N1]NOK67478.1 extracellular solute-binding protein [Chloroflexi bacterium AL-N10]NOK75030.1 extracellular solute-binding protein [Chloroflexi bacterium AL-N5]NOK81817.1 extracellular solute-binding protein [Chloroflexi bacterium AL-W]NOK89663.1 extracellular solute-binding protein [Chloroflexi bacterium AL-N15]